MEQAFCFEATTAKSASFVLDYSNSEAYQVVPSAVYLIIFGAIRHSLHGLEKFSVQIIRRISPYRFACHGLPCGLAGRNIVEMRQKGQGDSLIGPLAVIFLHAKLKKSSKKLGRSNK